MIPIRFTKEVRPATTEDLAAAGYVRAPAVSETEALRNLLKAPAKKGTPAAQNMKFRSLLERTIAYAPSRLYTAIREMLDA